MAVTRNARLFLERAGIRPTFRRPIPTTVPGDSAIHTYPLDRPDPRPRSILSGAPAPDGHPAEDDPWHLGLESES